MTDSIHVFQVDAEHGNLRLAVAGIFIVLVVLFFFLLAAVIPAEAVNFVALLGALVLASIATAAIEQTLKHRWPSGREIVYKPGYLELRQHGNTKNTMELNRETQLITWRFEISKRARVPRGWLMVAAAVRLIPEETYLPVYTLMSPEVFTAFEHETAFTELRKQDPDGDMRLAGEQRRLHAAESYRWQDGAEMTNEDFQKLYQLLRAQYED